MKFDDVPVLRASSVVFRNKTVFKTLTEEITVEVPNVVIRQMLDLCDGRTTVASVLNEMSSSWERKSVSGLLGDLFRKRIVVDGRNLIEEFWQVVTNPMLFPVIVSNKKVASLVNDAVDRHRLDICDKTYEPNLGNLEVLIASRKSTRIFSGEEVPIQTIVNMLWSAYGECFAADERSHRTVPSAGALYPLDIRVGLFQKSGDLAAGIYKACYDQNGSVGFKLITEDTLKFARAFLSPAGIQNGVHGAIVISGSFSVSNAKYGNRAMLYTTLEAGHVAQNILLEATQRGVATLEIGGFADDLVADAVNLNGKYHPLTVIAFGKEGFQSDSENSSPKPEVDWMIPLARNYKPSFALASARLSPGRNWAHGRDPSPKMAVMKATSEAREWTACGCIPDLIRARYKELDCVVDPRQIIRFHSRQYNLPGFPFVPFDESAQYAWTKAYDAEGKEFFVLADHVYFPYFPETPYYCYANSSGCAAHPNEQTAIETGTLELVERDAFMNRYLCRISAPIISPKTLPDEIQKRLQNLRRIGFNVWFLDHTLDLAPVIFVFAQNTNISFTACASCSSFDIAYATEHALTEVESSILYRLQHGPLASLLPNEVVWPNDHGRLYAQRRYFRQSDFLVSDNRMISFKDAAHGAAMSRASLMKRFNQKGWKQLVVPLAVSAKYGGNDGLHIVRTIVPGMTQMTFGYRQEPTGMPRIYQIAARFGRGITHHQLTKFPHPFE